MPATTVRIILPRYGEIGVTASFRAWIIDVVLARRGETHESPRTIDEEEDNLAQSLYMRRR